MLVQEEKKILKYLKYFSKTLFKVIHLTVSKVYSYFSVPALLGLPIAGNGLWENPFPDTQKLNYSFQNIPNSQYLQKYYMHHFPINLLIWIYIIKLHQWMLKWSHFNKLWLYKSKYHWLTLDKSILQTLHYMLPCNLKYCISYLCNFILDNWNFTEFNSK